MGYVKQIKQTWQRELQELNNVMISCDIQRDGIKLVFSAMTIGFGGQETKKISTGRTEQYHR